MEVILINEQNTTNITFRPGRFFMRELLNAQKVNWRSYLSTSRNKESAGDCCNESINNFHNKMGEKQLN